MKHRKLVFVCTGLIASMILCCTPQSHAAKDGEQSTEVHPTQQVQQPQVSGNDRTRWCNQAKKEIFNKCEEKTYNQIQDKLSDLLTPAAQQAPEAPGGAERLNTGIELLNELVHLTYRVEQLSDEKKQGLTDLLQKATAACKKYDAMENAPIDYQNPYTGTLTTFEPGTHHFMDTLKRHVDGVELTGVGVSGGLIGFVGGGVGAGHSSDPCGNKHRTVGAGSVLGMGGGLSAKAGQQSTLRTVEDGHYDHAVDHQMSMNLGAGLGVTLPMPTEVGQHFDGNGTVGLGVALPTMALQSTHTKTADLWPLPKFIYGRDFDFMRMCAQITPEHACLPAEVANQLYNWNHPEEETVHSEKEAQDLIKAYIKSHK